jgi:hypothetical protein
MWHFYTSLHLSLKDERLLGLEGLTRELGRQHCDHAQEWVRYLHQMEREVLVEELLWESESVSYCQQMREELKKGGVLGLLIPRLQEAVHKEERLFHLLIDEKTLVVQGQDTHCDQFGARLGSLEHSLNHLMAVRSEDKDLGTADLLISELMVPMAGT